MALERAHVDMIGLVHQIIYTFTYQVDAKKASKCNDIHSAVEQIISGAVNLGVSVLGAMVLTPLLAEGSFLGKSAAGTLAATGEVGTSLDMSASSAVVGVIGKDAIGKAEKQAARLVVAEAEDAELNGAIKAMAHTESAELAAANNAMPAAHPPEAANPPINAVTETQSIPVQPATQPGESDASTETDNADKASWWSEKGENTLKAMKKAKWEWSSALMTNTLAVWAPAVWSKHYRDFNQLPSVSGGVDHDSLCSSFEGGFQDTNPQNKDQLSERLSAVFAKTRQDNVDLFNRMYKGWVITPGKPTIGAAWMNSQKYTGLGSTDWYLENIDVMEK